MNINSHKADETIDAFADEHADAIQKAAMAGWATKGALYITLGVLAVMAAVGSGEGNVSGSTGVLQWVADQSYGTAMLVAAGIGFTGYAMWRLAESVVDPMPRDDGVKKLVKRVGRAASGLAHLSLAVASFQLLDGGAAGGTRRMWLDEILRESWGPVVIGVVGGFVIGVGLYQAKKALELRFMRDVETSSMSRTTEKALKWAGRVGLAARGVVFPIIGCFLIKAAIEADPSEAKGVGGALSSLADAGWYWLAIVAFGLAAYGVLNLLYARYRTVDVG
ncbi:MAG: DUF1206 domain-containing protein [Myxococcota bacterium]